MQTDIVCGLSTQICINSKRVLFVVIALHLYKRVFFSVIVNVWTSMHTHTDRCVCVCVLMCLYVCVCVCVCVCVERAFDCLIKSLSPEETAN